VAFNLLVAQPKHNQVEPSDTEKICARPSLFQYFDNVAYHRHSFKHDYLLAVAAGLVDLNGDLAP